MSAHEGTSTNFGDNSNFFNEIVELAKAKQLDSQLSRHSFELEERKVYSISIHQLMYNIYTEGYSSEDFINYAKGKMSDDICKEAERKIKGQKDDILWQELRFGRITASNVYEASRCQTANGSLLNRVIGAVKVFDNVHMKRGRELEELVIAEIVKKLKVTIEKSGLILIPSLPILGASPDGMGDYFVVEIKCPHSDKTLKNYISDGKISNKCKGQINLQMLAAKKKKALFCVADPQFECNKEFQFLWIDYDKEFTDSMIDKAVSFCKQHIFPVLMKSCTKNNKCMILEIK